jgi:hypothetical protein
MGQEALMLYSEEVSLASIAREAAAEAKRGKDLHGPMHSPHEGHSVLREEFEELWEEVRKRHPDKAKMRAEAIQVAAMAIRFVQDCT